MKILSTVFLAHLLCASAFGLHGTSTSSAIKKVGFARSQPAMVQAVDVQGRQLTVSSADVNGVLWYWRFLRDSSVLRFW